MEKVFLKKIKTLAKKDTIPFLCLGKKGIEKENIRINQLGKINNQDYPKKLGKALTHSYITKDYANAILEIVSPPMTSSVELFDFLEKLHTYIYQSCKDILWVNSFPPQNIKNITIATFGTCNKAKLKEYYRTGLKHRYGDFFQLFSGIHFNYSFHQEVLKALENDYYIQDKNSAYFDTIRNFLRYEFLLLYLFGSSVSEKFPFATSIRNSIYKNKNNFFVSMNSLKEYTDDLLSATSTPDEDYQKIDLKKKKEFLQLSTNKLQIENELYYSIRPKSNVSSFQRPLFNLSENGIDYLECRSLDLDTFSPISIDIETIYFLEIFFYFCLLASSPPLQENEQQTILEYKNKIALFGRKYKDFFSMKSLYSKEQLQDVLDAFLEIAKLLDASSKTKNYSKSLKKQIKILYNKEIPSAKLSELMQTHSLQDYILQQSKKKRDYFLQKPLLKEYQDYFFSESQDSFKKWQELENEKQEDFLIFLQNYLKKNNANTT